MRLTGKSIHHSKQVWKTFHPKPPNVTCILELGALDRVEPARAHPLQHAHLKLPVARPFPIKVMTFCWAGSEPYRWARQLPTETVPFTKTRLLSVMNAPSTLKQHSVAWPERRLPFLAPGDCALNVTPAERAVALCLHHWAAELCACQTSPSPLEWQRHWQHVILHIDFTVKELIVMYRDFTNSAERPTFAFYHSIKLL